MRTHFLGKEILSPMWGTRLRFSLQIALTAKRTLPRGGRLRTRKRLQTWGPFLRARLSSRFPKRC